MKISIRNARRIDQQLYDLVNDDLKTSVTVSIFNSVPDIDEAFGLLAKEVIDRNVYNRIRFIIRGLISDYNYESGITGLMLTENKVKELFVLYSSIINAAVNDYDDVDAIKREIDSMRDNHKSDTSFGGGRTTLSISLINSSDVDEYRTMAAELKKQMSGISDDILSLNLTGFIELDNDLANVLVKLGLI